MTIDKTFDPAAIEARWYPHWELGGRFRPAREDAQPFTIVIPPPNVTGSLHIGHALDLTLQDILVRHARLQGKDALWVVGTDHAGIATQMVVERNLAGQGLTRQEMGREAFVARVWEWKAESGGAITRQLRRLGASCDWSREQFTMDPHFSKAVTRVFVELYRRKLLYRDKRLVNWDPHFRTAISDLEVETRETHGKFWHLRYPLADGSGTISVATTRPETMLADMAVAVHPDDERYAALVGKKVRLPITGRLVPIVADEHADPALGSGAVKITPGHDFNDFEVGVRAGIKPADMLNMLDAEAKVAQTADGLIPAALIGIDRFAARDLVVRLLEEAGALDKVEDRTIQTPHGDRSGAVIEPWLTDQWYVDAKTLAGPALEAVRQGRIRVVPETWKKTYYNWLENIQPWCVSRQLWWGHQIPAWYGPKINLDGGVVYDPGQNVGGFKVFVAADQGELNAALSEYYKDRSYQILDTASEADRVLKDRWRAGDAGAIVIWRDSDVLDTWFSSALWPFGTLGWPEDETAPLVPSEVEGRAPGAVPGVSTSLDTNGLGSVAPTSGAGNVAPTSLLARHYPNDVLISGFDILFFWDARMIMQGLQFMGEVPFRTLYLHGLVRDAQGAKMSKSKGNTVDPLELIDRYGADALRFTLAAMESQGRDIKLDEKRVEGYRNFATKLWNAARFAQANGIGGSDTPEPPRAELAVNRWIIAETQTTIQALDLALADLRFDEAANILYHFVWDRYCDWYLELIKPVLAPLPPAGGAGGPEAPHDALADSPTPDPSREREGRETRIVAGWVLDRILILLHPFMPFVTEELWHALAAREHDLIVAQWPRADARAIDPGAVAEVEWLIGTVQEVRAVRSELGIAPGRQLDMYLRDPSIVALDMLSRQVGALARFAKLNPVSERLPPAGAAAQIVVRGITFVLPLEGVIDLAAESARLDKAATAAEKERDALAGRLGNAAFVDKAKPEAVAKAREDHAARAAEAERLRAALARLG